MPNLSGSVSAFVGGSANLPVVNPNSPEASSGVLFWETLRRCATERGL